MELSTYAEIALIFVVVGKANLDSSLDGPIAAYDSQMTQHSLDPGRLGKVPRQRRVIVFSVFCSESTPVHVHYLTLRVLFTNYLQSWSAYV